MATPTPPKKILLAEDVRALSMRLSHALETHGYIVCVAEDGEDCLEQMEKVEKKEESRWLIGKSR